MTYCYPSLLPATSPDLWPLSTLKYMGMCTAQQLRSHITQALAKETTGSTATHNKIDLVHVWNSLSMFRKMGPPGHHGHLFPAGLSSGHLNLCSLEQ